MADIYGEVIHSLGQTMTIAFDFYRLYLFLLALLGHRLILTHFAAGGRRDAQGCAGRARRQQRGRNGAICPNPDS